jgi:uroporphyrin-3 C-methyltransferase
MNDTIKFKHTKLNKPSVRGHGFIIFLSLMLSLCAVCGGSYLYYQALQAKTQLDLKLSDLNNQYTTQLNANVATIQELKQNITAVQDNVAKLNVATNLNKSKLVIYQLSELINMANQALIVYNDIKGTIQLLTYAQEILNGNNNAELVGLKLALAKNLEQLSQVAAIDNVALIGKLDAVMSQAQNLPIYKKANISLNNKQNNKQYLAQENSIDHLNQLWQKFWANIKADIALIIKVTTPSTNNLNASGINSPKIILLPADVIIVRQNIKLYLLNARVALLQQDQDSWHMSLINAAKCFANFFPTDGVVVSIVNSLNDMANTNIAHNAVNLNATLQALNVTVNLLK